jgi:hypothetical protein
VKIELPNEPRQPAFANVVICQQLGTTVFMDFGFVDPSALTPEQLPIAVKRGVKATPLGRFALSVVDAMNLRQSLDEIISKAEESSAASTSHQEGSSV